MSYTVLARKYRSQRFDDVIGQEPIAQTLKNAIKTDKVAHAYLFTGTRGTGKTTMARILAKALNCLSFDSPTAEPCCKCDSCIAINAGEDIDVIEIDGASNRGIDNIRELRQNAIYRPARSRFKIYIIDEVHMLTTESFNALLKTLEEPPSHVKFIFATTEPNKVIPTIQSRCQRFDFRNISPASIAKQLKFVLEQENIKYSDELVLSLAKMANGSMRDALSLLDRLISTGIEPLTAELLEEFLGCPNSEKIYNLVAAIGDNDASGVLAAADDLINSGLGEVQIVDALIEYMRDLMVIKAAGAGKGGAGGLILTEGQRKQASVLVEKFDIAALIYDITALEKLRWAIKNSDTARAILEASLLRFALSEHFLNVDTLLRQQQGGSAEPVKKKQPVIHNPAVKVSDESAGSATSIAGGADKSTDEKPLHHLRLNDLESAKNNWQNVLKAVVAKSGSGTAGFLSSAVPSRFEDGILTLSFPASGEMLKKIFESNGRRGQIESLLSEHFKSPVQLRFETAVGEHTQTESAASQPKIGSQRKDEIINDPAVRTVLLGLDATITGIEEDQQKD